MSLEPERAAHDERGLSPVVGVVLLVGITLLLAAVGGAFALGLADTEQPAPQAVLNVQADAYADQVRIRHVSGDALSADRTRVVWELDGERYVTSPAGDTETSLLVGQTTTATFDGSTDAQGQWWPFPSPGEYNLAAGDEVTVTVYDTASNKPVFQDTVQAEDGDGPLTGGFIWAHDGTAGRSDVTYEMRFTIRSGSDTVGNSLDEIKIDLDSSAGPVFSTMTRSDIEAVGIDTDGDGVIDQEIKSDVESESSWTKKDGDSTVLIGLTGSAYTNAAGDTIILRTGGVDNPSTPGSYDVQASTSDDDNYQYGSIDID